MNAIFFLETIAYAVVNASNLPPCPRFVCLSLSEFYGHAMLIGNSQARKERDVYLLRFGAVACSSVSYLPLTTSESVSVT